MDTSREERRAARRFRMQVPVTFPEGTGVTGDISASGVRFVTSSPVWVGQRVELEVTLDGAVARGSATVVRARTRPRGMHEVAASVSFRELGPADVERAWETRPAGL